MKKAYTKIDFQQKISNFGKKVDIKFTCTGQYCIKLDNKFSGENAFKANAVFFCKKYWLNALE